MVGIYCITSPSGKKYIGQSINIEQRKKIYYGHHCKKQIKLHASLLKYGFDKHTFEIIEECEEGKLNEREEFWITELQTCNYKIGMNLSSGGLNKRVSEETKARISIGNTGKKKPLLVELNKSRKGQKLTPEHKEKMRQSMIGRTHSLESIEKMKVSRKEFHIAMTEDRKDKMRLKMSNSAKKKVLSPEHQDKINKWVTSADFHNINAKKIINIETGIIYRSLGEAAISSKYCYGHFKRMMSGVRINKTPYQYLAAS